MKDVRDTAGESRYLSPANVWALVFGCVAGWGAFVSACAFATARR